MPQSKYNKTISLLRFIFHATSRFGHRAPHTVLYVHTIAQWTEWTLYHREGQHLNTSIWDSSPSSSSRYRTLVNRNRAFDKWHEFAGTCKWRTSTRPNERFLVRIHFLPGTILSWMYSDPKKIRRPTVYQRRRCWKTMAWLMCRQLDISDNSRAASLDISTPLRMSAEDKAFSYRILCC